MPRAASSMLPPPPSRPRTAPTSTPPRPLIAADASAALLLGGQRPHPFSLRAERDGAGEHASRRQREKLSKGLPVRLYDPSDSVRSWRLAESLPVERLDSLPPHDMDLPNLSRSLRADWGSLAREREQLKAERAALSADRAAIEAMRDAQRHEALSLADQRRALQQAREELLRNVPEHAAARIQARVRAIRTRIDAVKLRRDAAEKQAREASVSKQQRLSALSAWRRAALAAAQSDEAHRAREKLHARVRQQQAAVVLQGAARRHLARGHFAVLQREQEERKLQLSYQEEARRHEIEALASRAAPPRHPKESSAAPRRLEERRRRAAAVRLQSAYRAVAQRRLYSAALARRREEQAERVRTRVERRQQRLREKMARAIQSHARGRLARVAFAKMREAQKLKAARPRAAAAPAADALAGAGGAPLLPSIPGGVSHSSRCSSPLGESRLPSREESFRSDHPYVVLHSAELGDIIHNNPAVKQVWVEVQLADGRLLSNRTPPHAVPWAAAASAARRTVDFGGVRFLVDLSDAAVASEVGAILAVTDDEDADADVVFTLYGAPHGANPRTKQYLGEGYVNLQQIYVTGRDVFPSEPLEVLNTSKDGEDVHVAYLHVSVIAVNALTAFLRRAPPPPRCSACSSASSAVEAAPAAAAAAPPAASARPSAAASRSHPFSQLKEAKAEALRQGAADAVAERDGTLPKDGARELTGSRDKSLEERHDEHDFEVLAGEVEEDADSMW